MIGIITNNATHIFQHRVITGVRDIAAQAGHEVIVDAIGTFPQQQALALDMSQLAGIIVISNVLRDEALIALHNAHIPMTLVSHRVHRVPIPSVIPNNTDGIRRIVDFVVRECGRERIVFIQGDMTQHDGIVRTNVFNERLLMHNLMLPIHYLLRGDFDPAIAAQSTRDFLQSGTPFDALIAADYPTGCAALTVLTDAGYRIPDAVCVAGFGDGPEAISANLTTVGVDIVELGRRTARQLMTQIAGHKITGVTWLNTELIERATTRRISATQGSDQ